MKYIIFHVTLMKHITIIHITSMKNITIISIDMNIITISYYYETYLRLS